MDGKKILTGSYDETARVWDAKTGHELLMLKGHTGAINSAAFSPDGKQILTGSLDTTARLWDALTGQEIITFKGHTGWINSVAFSPDGKQILTGSNDKTARIWRRMTEAQAAEIERSQIAKQEALTKLSKTPLAQVVNVARNLWIRYPTIKTNITITLNEIAWNIVDRDKPRPTNEIARQALNIATLAVQYSEEKEGNYLDTLASAQFACDDLDSALATERKAVRLLPNDKDLQAALARYEKLKSEQKK